MHWQELVSYAQLELHGDRADAEDLTAGAIARFACGDFDSRPIPDAKLRAFARGVIRNESKHAVRVSSRLDLLSEQLAGVTWPDESQSARYTLLRRDLAEALNHLTPAERNAIELHYLRGWTVPEIAHAQRITCKTVKELVRRAKHKLRWRLASYDPCG